MKKICFLIISACLFCVNQTIAGNILTVNDVNVPKGGQAALEIGCEFDTEYTAFELQIALPEGLSLLTDEDGYPIIERAFESNHILTGNLLPSNGNYKITCRSMENVSIPTSGVLFRVAVVANDGLVAGTSLFAAITASEFTRTSDSTGENLSDVGFSVNIVDFRVLLDEASATEPEPEIGVNVRVKKTIQANEWSTICLPFSMTEEQVAMAFGSDVQIGDFNDYEMTDDESSITVNFNIVQTMAANHPYIIKVSNTVEEFMVDNVDINPQDAEINKGTKRRPHSFVGNYEAGMTVEEECLLLVKGVLLYSDGTETINGFSCYFDFIDVLESSDPKAELRTDIDESVQGCVLMHLSFRTSTMIGMERQQCLESQRTYTISGQQVLKPNKKGVYIQNNQKVVLK